MGTIPHSTLAGSENHATFAFVYASAAEMYAATSFTNDDVGKVAKVGSGTTIDFYTLVGISPIRWVKTSARFEQTIAQFTGTLSNTTGTMKWFPHSDIELYDIMLAVGVVSTADITLTLKKNYSTVHTITLTAGSAGSSRELIAGPISLYATDFLTADIVATDGQDLSAVIRYKLK